MSLHTTDIDEYNITVKVRNNLLLQAIKSKGGTPGQVIAAKIGIRYQTLNDYITLKLSPIDANNEYRESAYKICDFFNMSPSELWTEEQLTPLEKSTVELTASYEQLSAYLPSHGDPSTQLELEDMRESIAHLLENIDSRGSYVIKRRFGIEGEAATREKVAEELGVSAGRIHQIEARVLRVLRLPEYTESLRGFIDPNDDPVYKKQTRKLHDLEKQLMMSEITYQTDLEYRRHCTGEEVNGAKFRPHMEAGRSTPSEQYLNSLKFEIEKLKEKIQEIKLKRTPWKARYNENRE